MNIEAAFFVVVFRLVLWCLPSSSITRVPVLRAREAGDRIPSAEIARAVSAVPLGNCLVHAFASQWMLARHGHPALIRIGVSKQNGFAAHAWVECEGVVACGVTSGAFEPLLALGAKA